MLQAVSSLLLRPRGGRDRQWRDYRERILSLSDQRLSKEGVIVIKSQRYRSRDRNRTDALEKLTEMIKSALEEQKPRKKTKPSRQSKEKRLDEKSKRAQLKQTRRKISE